MKRLLFSLCTLVWASTLSAAETPSPDKLLPGDTLAVLTLPEYAKASATWKKAPYGQLWNDPALKPFRDKFTTKFKSDVVEPLEREFGIRIADYAGLAQGQVTFALTPGEPAKPDEGPGFLLLVDTKDKREVLKTNLASLKRKWTDGGKQMRPEKIREVEFTTLIFSSDDFSEALEKAFPKNKDEEEPESGGPKKEPRKVEWFVGQSDSLLILGNVSKDIEKVLVRQSGGSVPSLAEQPGFAARYGSMFRDAPAYAWVNLKAFVEQITKAAAAEEKPSEPSPMALPKADKVLGLLGFTSLESLSLNLQQTADGLFINTHIQSPESGRKGIARLLSHQPKDSDPPSFVPADAVKFFRWRLDLQKAWTGVEAMIGEISPQYANLVKTMLELAGKQDNPNFDFRKQVIGNLGDDLISYEKTPREQTLEGLNSPPSLFLLSSPNAEDLALGIKAIVAFLQQGTKVKEREFLGRKVYTLAMPSYDREGKRRDRSLHYCASGGYVGFSFDVAMLEEYLRGSPSKALRDTPGLADAVQKIGGMSTGLFGYENHGETSRASFEILKKESGTLANLLNDSPLAGRFGMDRGNDKFKEWFDFSLLPPWDKISKYFSSTVWAGALNSEGMTIKVFSPTPPQLKGQ